MDKNYELFIKQLTNGIHNITDIPLENIKFTNKEGDRLNITFAEHDDAYEVCSVHVDELYTAYQDGVKLNAIINYFGNDVLHAKNNNIYDKTKTLMDYDTAKSRLFVRLINYDGSGVDPKDLKLVLRDTLREVTPSSDYLTEKIYKYNRRTHKFECVTD